MIEIDGHRHDWKPSMTVAELLASKGQLNDCYVVQMNDQYIAKNDFEKVQVPDNARIVKVHIIAGG